MDPEEIAGRLAAIETSIIGRKELADERHDHVVGKLDKLLDNSTGYATYDHLKKSFKEHTEACPARQPARQPSNPTPPKANAKNDISGKLKMVVSTYKQLGVTGVLLVIIILLVLLRMAEQGMF